MERLPRAQRREQLLHVAAGAFLRGGFDGTSMDDVARAAGVTRLIVYRIFESKDDLYRAVLDDVVGDLATTFGMGRAEILARHGGFGRALLDVARRHPDAFRLLWRHAAHEPAFAEYATLFVKLAVDYSETMLHEEITDPRLLHWAARTMIGYLWDGICTWLEDGEPARDEQFVDMLSDGSRALVAAWTTAP
jgi:AcrR family transcriptional regulator